MKWREVMLPFLPSCPTVVPLPFWSKLPSGASHATFGMAVGHWKSWTVQVREYDCPVIAKVEGVNWTFGRE